MSKTGKSSFQFEACIYIFYIIFNKWHRAKILGGMPTSLMQRQQEINNDNSCKTVKSRLTFISAFSIMVTVTLMKTAVAKNLSQSIIICVEHQNFSKSIRQACQCPIFGGMPGHPLASITGRHCFGLYRFYIERFKIQFRTVPQKVSNNLLINQNSIFKVPTICLCNRIPQADQQTAADERERADITVKSHSNRVAEGQTAYFSVLGVTRYKSNALL